ncbi:uncharacterized protein LOC113859493 [Abrus precatorius]|uniref:Uncharacterized protein LOC113859493 n=1 Tax=Abrus precatorius TaxID=3816 RepID=A0A8B8KXH5_ABRPR|nr:uncharacterized protein LOC113859493 [Abrus precatorius]
MEPPHAMLGGAEECHSSESGWTMYIGSPVDEHANSDYKENDENLDYDYDYDYEGTHADPDVESDDSMASDASSGPSYYGIINPLGNDYDGFTHFQQKEEEKAKYCSDHKRATSKKSENRLVDKRVEKNEMVFINGKGKAQEVQNGGNVKARKTLRVGTKK